MGELGTSLQVSDAAHGRDRRVVRVLFADMVSSTELAERLDPEDMRGILKSLFNALATEVRRFGATIDKYAGDGGPGHLRRACSPMRMMSRERWSVGSRCRTRSAN